MFTNEFIYDGSVTTILDETDEFEDVQLIIADDTVYIRQWCDEHQAQDLISLTPKMFKDMLEAMNHTEGMFVTNYKRSE